MQQGNVTKVTTAMVMLNQVSKEDLEPSSTFFSSPKKQVSSSSFLSPTASPIKKSEKPRVSVGDQIKAMEKQTEDNHAGNFFPRPDNKSFNVKRNIFVTQDQQLPLTPSSPIKKNTNSFLNKSKNPFIETTTNKFSKSEQKRTNEINNAMAGSPSKQNLKNYNTIKRRLVSNPKYNDLSSTEKSKVSDISQSQVKGIPKTFSTKNLTKHINASDSTAFKSWLDNDRENTKLAAFVCRMIEIKRWIESLLNISIGLDDSNIDQFPDYLVNGIILIKLAQYFDPKNTKKKIEGIKGDGIVKYKMTQKDFKVTENILAFTNFVKRVKLPSVFIFETNDLYEKKDIPKVIACLHALSCLMKSLGKCPPVCSLTDGNEPSSALFDLNLNINNLKQIKYTIGRDSLKRNTVEGFDEAVRVNVGNDIKKLQLIQIEEEEKKKEVELKPIPQFSSVEDNKLETNPNSNDIDNSILTITNDAGNDTLSSIDISLSLDGLSDSDSSLMLDSPILTPPSSQELEETKFARQLFNDKSVISRSTSEDSFSAIHEKYKFLINEDERRILGDSFRQSISKLPSDASKSSISSFDSMSTITSEIAISESVIDEKYNDIIKLQSLARGYLLRYFTYVDKTMLSNNTTSIIKFQSICRGILKRQKISQHNSSNLSVSSEIETDQELNELISIFGSSQMMRTILKNKTKHAQLVNNLSNLREYEFDLINFESIIRGGFVREKQWLIRKFLMGEINIIIKIQSLSRGLITRKFIKRGKLSTLSRHKRKPPPRLTKKIDTLKPVRAIHESPFNSLYDEDDLFEKFDISTKLPSKQQLEEEYYLNDRISRREELKPKSYMPNLPITPPKEMTTSRKVSRIHHSPTKKRLSSFIPIDKRSTSTLLFPSVSQQRYTSPTNEQIQKLESFTEEIIEFQSIVRGAFLRGNINTKLDEIYSYGSTFSRFVSNCRCKLVRQSYKELRKELHETQNEVIAIQSLVRGIFKRVDYDILVEDIRDYSQDFIPLQSHIRGVLVRSRIIKRDEWFRRSDNLKKICKLQAIIKGANGFNDYRKLLKSKNPPLSAITNYIELFTQSEDIKSKNDELEILKLRALVNDEKKEFQTQIEKMKALQIKVGILKKYGINLKDIEGILKTNVDGGNEILNKLVDPDEIVSHISSLNKETAVIPTEKRVSINKDLNDLSTSIGRLFCILQNKPLYWSTVLDFIEVNESKVEFTYGVIEDWVLKCYNYDDVGLDTTTEPTREEYSLLKLIINTFELSISREDFREFKKVVKDRSYFNFNNIEISNWELLIHSYLNLPQQRKLTKKLLDSSVFLVTGDDESNFECDEFKIFEYLVENSNFVTNEEINDVKAGIIEPLSIKYINEQYIKNIENLRDCVFSILINLKKNVDNFPFFIRCLLKEIYTRLLETYGNKVSEIYYLSMIGSIFMKCYIIPIFNTPSNYSIDIFSISDDIKAIELLKRNLENVSILLNQCGSLKKFESKEYKYLKSLDPFIEKIKPFMIEFLKDLINIPTIDTIYNFVLLDSTESELNIKYEDLIEIISMWKEFDNSIIKSEIKNDKLITHAITEIENKIDLKTSLRNKKLPCDKYGYCTIKFNNLIDDANNEVNILAKDLLLYEAKIYLIYVLQVQKGSKNLLDLLNSNIQPADELKFKEIIKREKKLKLSNLRNDYLIIDKIHHSTFPIVKQRLVELIIQLEDLEVISQDDEYQKLLNDLAQEVKDKHLKNEMRQNEKLLINSLLIELKRRSNTYKNKYNDYEETIRLTLNKKLLKNEEIKSKSNKHIKNDSKFFKKLFTRSGYKIRNRLRSNSKSVSTNTDADYGTFIFNIKILNDKGVIKTNNSVRGTLNISCYKPQCFTISFEAQEFKISLNDILEFVYNEQLTVKAFSGIEFVSVGLLKTIISSFYSD